MLLRLLSHDKPIHTQEPTPSPPPSSSPLELGTILTGGGTSRYKVWVRVGDNIDRWGNEQI